jgi:hypothetical protein
MVRYAYLVQGNNRTGEASAMEDRDVGLKHRKRKKAFKIFYSYAHEDERWREELEKHLSLLQRESLITGWHDRNIKAGDEWQKELNKNLQEADVILLLVSPDFIASDYCYSVEVQFAMHKQKLGEVVVIPIILRPVDWHRAPFGKLQALPRDGKPITTSENQDQAFYEVALGIRDALERLRTVQK